MTIQYLYFKGICLCAIDLIIRVKTSVGKHRWLLSISPQLSGHNIYIMEIHNDWLTEKKKHSLSKLFNTVVTWKCVCSTQKYFLTWQMSKVKCFVTDTPVCVRMCVFLVRKPHHSWFVQKINHQNISLCVMTLLIN